jgi:hypothetical protein
VRDAFYEVSVDGQWKIEAGSTNLGPYRSRQQAIQAAVNAAVGATRNGWPCQVIAQGEQTETWGTIWPPPASAAVAAQ